MSHLRSLRLSTMATVTATCQKCLTDDDAHSHTYTRPKEQRQRSLFVRSLARNSLWRWMYEHTKNGVVWIRMKKKNRVHAKVYRPIMIKMVASDFFFHFIIFSWTHRRAFLQVFFCCCWSLLARKRIIFHSKLIFDGLSFPFGWNGEIRSSLCFSLSF